MAPPLFVFIKTGHFEKIRALQASQFIKNGVFDKNPHIHADSRLIPEIRNIDEAKLLVEERDSGLGIGGMNSKLEAAMICQREGIETWIVNGGLKNFLADALNEKIEFTKFAN